MPTIGCSQKSFLREQIVKLSPEEGPQNFNIDMRFGRIIRTHSVLSDLIDYVEADITIKDATKTNRVIGIGTTLHKFQNDQGKDIFLPCVYYHLPQTYV